MKRYQRIGLLVIGIGAGASALIAGLRNCSDYEIINAHMTSHSRATGFYSFTDKIEYTRLKDGSEEILIRDGKRIFRYQNLDGDDRIDRIRIDRYTARDIFALEDILVRPADYPTNKDEFDKADSILLKEREK